MRFIPFKTKAQKKRRSVFALLYKLTDKSTQEDLRIVYDRQQAKACWKLPGWCYRECYRTKDQLKRTYYTLIKRNVDLLRALRSAEWVPNHLVDVLHQAAQIVVLGKSAHEAQTDPTQLWIPVFKRTLSPAQITELSILGPFRERLWKSHARSVLVSFGTGEFYARALHSREVWQEYFQDPEAALSALEALARQRSGDAHAKDTARALLYVLTRLSVGDHAATMAILAGTRHRRAVQRTIDALRAHPGARHLDRVEHRHPVAYECTIHGAPRTTHGWKAVLPQDLCDQMARVLHGYRLRTPALFRTPTALTVGTHFTRGTKAHVSVALVFHVKTEDEERAAHRTARLFFRWLAQRVRDHGRVTFAHVKRTLAGSSRLPYTLPTYAWSPYKDGDPGAIQHVTHPGAPAVLYAAGPVHLGYTTVRTKTHAPGAPVPVMKPTIPRAHTNRYRRREWRPNVRRNHSTPSVVDGRVGTFSVEVTLSNHRVVSSQVHVDRSYRHVDRSYRHVERSQAHVDRRVVTALSSSVSRRTEERSSVVDGRVGASSVGVGPSQAHVTVDRGVGSSSQAHTVSVNTDPVGQRRTHGCVLRIDTSALRANGLRGAR